MEEERLINFREITSASRQPSANGRTPHTSLIKTFLYFAIFKHPLTKEEALRYCQHSTSSIDAELTELLDKKLLFKIQDFYLPYNYPEWVERRIKGNILSEKKMIKARKMAKILNYFPYVRSVMVSGSLSKGFMDEKSDIDFFIIMRPGSLAISKFLMGLFRRFFAPKSFCINFLIDTDNLQIQKKNLYTAIEMVTLIPMIDANLYKIFMRVNMDWIRNFLPNAIPGDPEMMPFKKKGLQSILETIFSSSIGSQLDAKLREKYKRRLALRAAKESHESGEVVINKGVIKLHGKPYQKKIMNLYSKYQKDFYIERELVFNEHFHD